MPICPECETELDYQEEDYESGSWYMCVPCGINVCIRQLDKEVSDLYEEDDEYAETA